MNLFFILSFSLISAESKVQIKITDHRFNRSELFELDKSSESEKKRESVVAVWRHGRRSPMIFLPKLNDSVDMWPDGTRQLTARGIEGFISSFSHQIKSSF